MKINDKVHIKPFEDGKKISGRIIAIYEDSTGLQYKVRFFKEFEACEVYFYADELELT